MTETSFGKNSPETLGPFSPGSHNVFVTSQLPQAPFCSLGEGGDVGVPLRGTMLKGETENTGAVAQPGEHSAVLTALRTRPWTPLRVRPFAHGHCVSGAQNRGKSCVLTKQSKGLSLVSWPTAMGRPHFLGAAPSQLQCPVPFSPPHSGPSGPSVCLRK